MTSPKILLSIRLPTPSLSAVRWYDARHERILYLMKDNIRTAKTTQSAFWTWLLCHLDDRTYTGTKEKNIYFVVCPASAISIPKGWVFSAKKWQIKSLRSMIYSYGRCQSRACCDLVYWLPDQIIQASINLPPHQRYSQTGKTTSISDHIKSCRSISKFSILGLKELATFTQRIFRFETFIFRGFRG